MTDERNQRLRDTLANQNVYLNKSNVNVFDKQKSGGLNKGLNYNDAFWLIGITIHALIE